jgi:hypothetical protein
LPARSTAQTRPMLRREVSSMPKEEGKKDIKKGEKKET